MGIVDRLFPRSGRASAAPEVRSAAAGKLAVSGETAALERRRKELSKRLADRQWDLGGVTYEMAVRDHFRLDVLLRLSSELQQIDAELAEVERQIKLGENGAAGNCPACRAQHSRGAAFCWSCGHQLMGVNHASGQGEGAAV